MSIFSTPPSRDAAWIFLLIAGCLEVAWAIGLKYTRGFTVLLPSLLTAGAMALSFFFLAQSLRVLPVGTGYAVWTGIGAVGTALFGIVLFQEPASAPRLACIALIVTGVFGLKIFGG